MAGVYGQGSLLYVQGVRYSTCRTVPQTTSEQSTGSRLYALVLSRSGEAFSRWQAQALAATPANLNPLLNAMASAPRVVGRGPLQPSAAEVAALAEAVPGLQPAGWAVMDAARAAVLLHLAETWPADDFFAAAVACYEQGDAREQESWLKALPCFPGPERFLPYAYDACRTNIQPVFEAIACENPFPAQYYPALHFNQLVLRSLFLAVRLDRIVGRAARLNPELTRMASDYADERRAAGRAVPADLHLALHTEQVSR